MTSKILCGVAGASIVFLGSALFGPPAVGMDLYENPNDLKWTAAPNILPKGAEIVVLTGNPMGKGDYALRLKLPANYRIMPHHHPTVENVTVISGTLYAGMGDKFDGENKKEIKAGGFVAMPAGMNHFAWTNEPAVLQVHGDGPFEVIYVDPKDDPRKN